MYKQDNVINNAFHDVALQEPSPLKDKSKCIPFVTTFYNKFGTKLYLKNVFQDVNRLLAQRQLKKC